jgi:uncharacterized protein HemY
MLNELGRLLVFAGVSLVILGVLVSFLSSKNFPTLPGDILIKKDNFTVYVPITTSVVFSIVLTLIVNLFRK